MRAEEARYVLTNANWEAAQVLLENMLTKKGVNRHSFSSNEVEALEVALALVERRREEGV